MSDDATVSLLACLEEKLDLQLAKMERAPTFARISHLQPVLDLSRRMILQPGGAAALEARAPMIEAAGVFDGTDWGTPQILIPAIATQSLENPDAAVLMMEVLSDLRFLAVACGTYQHALLSSEEAMHHLRQVLALNLAKLFNPPGEADRVRQGRLAEVPHQLLLYVADRIGYESVIDSLIDEIWRMLRQRPIVVDSIKHMITQIAVCQRTPDIDLGASGQGAERLVSSLYGPTQGCREDPGTDVYLATIQSMDRSMLLQEATGFARAMHDTGLVSPYHAVLLRHLLDTEDALIGEALGLSSTGRESLLCYRDLIYALITESVFPETAQGIYGLALLLERGILYQPPVAPALWRQLRLTLCPTAEQRLQLVLGDAVAPRVWLLQGVLCMLGLPFGVGQGNHPTCQSARALSMWAYSDTAYLLQMVAWAARDDEIRMHFEGQLISSCETNTASSVDVLFDVDAVSLLVVPHLDRIYAQMIARCHDREGDPHRWVNPEFHGWWAGRGFWINVDVPTGKVTNLDGFLRMFYACYHPLYNGNQPLIHPQPAGIAVTDSAARFVGWHAITILRVGLDADHVMRVYFYNPNNDNGQDWGDGVVVSTAGKGERYGESSLLFEQFAARLYIFHIDPLEADDSVDLPQGELQSVQDAILASWAQDKV